MNTCLIDAAPDLLNRLKELLAWANIQCSTNRNTKSLYDDCTAAIDKAEGRTAHPEGVKEISPGFQPGDPDQTKASVSAERLAPFAERAEKMLARVFGGLHHVHKLQKYHDYWTCFQPQGGFATFDGTLLTRLVLGGHEYCLRVQISSGPPHQLKLHISPRKTLGAWHERHPTIEEAIEEWSQI